MVPAESQLTAKSAVKSKFPHSIRSAVEVGAHLLFWVFIFSAVNVEWASDWLDRSIRPDTPAPLSVIIFPLLFYAHAFWAIPRLLNHRKYAAYLGSLLLIFFLPELARAGIISTITNVPLSAELSSKDNLLTGSPMIAWLAFLFSTAYRFTKDWFLHHQMRLAITKPSSPLEKDQAMRHYRELQELMQNEKPHLNPDLTLRSLASKLDLPDKTLSKLLNQNLNSNFSDFVNDHRINQFLLRVEMGDLKNLSIAGLAMQCGFSSKSSFYRAFKKKTGTTPSDYLQNNC